ncbi:MAG: radical SAM protein [Bacteroides sp.]|nr:radical SAM protein [Bacteroides sp.]
MHTDEKLFELERSAIATSLRCNFKCKLCGAYSPYYNNAPIFSYENLTRSIEKIFSMVDRINKFTITGGEPFLHPQLSEIISYILLYKKQIGTLEIITNGSIAANTNLINVCNASNQIEILVDDYGPDLSKNVLSLKESFEKNSISFRIRKYYGEDAYCGGWIDYGSLTQKLFTDEEITENFNKCFQHSKLHFCWTIVDGKMYPCSVTRRCLELGITNYDNSEYIDLFDERSSTEKKQNQIKNIVSKKYLSACAFCNGFNENSPRFPPAEQLTYEEILKLNS